MNSKELKKLGINIDDIRIVRNVKELWESPPNFVTAKTKINCTIHVDKYPIKLKSGDKLVMPLEFYNNSKRTSERRIILKPCKKTFSSMFKRYKGQNLENKTLLIIRTGGIGDILFTQPLCKFIKDKWPTCRIIFATAPRYASIFKCFPDGLIDDVLSIPFRISALEETDYHLSFEGTIERNLEARKKHAFKIFAEMANLDVDFEKYKTELITNKSLDEEIEDIIPDNYVILQFRATSPIRMMSSDKWKGLIKRFCEISDLNFVLIDSNEKHQMYNNIIDYLSDGDEKIKSRLFNLCKYSISLSHAVSIVNASNGVVGIDSSLNHIGGALNKPILGLFAPFNANLRLKYYDKADWVQLESSKCGRFPCFFHGNEGSLCEYVSSAVPPICMEELDNDLIVEKFKNIFVK